MTPSGGPCQLAKNEPDAGGESGYGYFWWYSCYPTAAGLIEARTAVGNGQQRVFVLPGLDTVVKVARDMYDAYGDRFHVPKRMEELVSEGHLGAKTGKGFYEH